MKIITLTLLAMTLLMAPVTGLAQDQDSPRTCDCDLSMVPGLVWWGSRSEMTVQELASYAAPVIWFSPDEPSLNHKHGPDIAAPEPFPFQDIPGPVVYYQLKKVLRDGTQDLPAFSASGPDKGSAIIDFKSAGLLLLEYYAYFAEEWGLGAHVHDVEPVEFKIAITSTDGEYLQDKIQKKCDQKHYTILVARVSGKAHGIEWFWNVLDVDEQTQFPMTVLVEEGKHALATDKNGDGYFTPTYDVNVRVNDAWGVRDIIRSGGLFSGGYQAWMTKVRHPAERVFPPLPADSPLLENLGSRQDQYTGGNAVYSLHPLPTVAEAAAYDAAQGNGSHLAKFLVDKEIPDAPEIEDLTTMKEAFDWLDAGALKRSFSISFYTDGRAGFSWSFPFFVVKNLNVPMTGGYILHRMYAKGYQLRDFGWTALYAPSASRWVDTYLAAGVEWHEVIPEGESDIKADFILETGLKFRAQIGSTPLRFLTFLTDFWGVRLGIKNYGGFDIDRLTYVVEVGAGSF